MSDDTDTVGDYGLLDTRYALYFAPPPGSPLKQLADAWLGRDPDSDERVSQPVVRRHPARTAARDHRNAASLRLPRDPVRRRSRRPPGLEVDALLGDVEAFAHRRRPFMSSLVLGELDGFLALVPRRAQPGTRPSGGRLRRGVRPLSRRAHPTREARAGAAELCRAGA